MIFSNIVVLKS